MLCTVLLGAAPSSWPMYQFAPSHEAVFASSEPVHQWRFSAGAKINGGLAIVGDTLYVETFAPEIVALDRSAGRVLWRRHLPNIAMTTPIVADGLVIVATGKDSVLLQTASRLVWGIRGGDEVAAFDANSGRERWSFATAGEDMPSPALVRIGNRDAIVYANGDDHVRALDVETGRLLWTTSLDGVSTMASAATLGGIVYVIAGTPAIMHRPDHVYAVRASDGHIVWSAPYGNADDSPVIGDGRLFVEDAQMVTGGSHSDAINDIYALDLPSGRLEWARNSGAGYFTTVGTNEQAIAALIDHGALFQSLPAVRRFAAYDDGQGRPFWSIQTQAAVKMSAVALDGELYVGDTAGVLYTIDEGDGRIRAQQRFPQPFTCSSPVIVGSTLYVADGESVDAIALARR